MDSLFETKRLAAYPAKVEEIEKIQALEKNPDYHAFIHYESKETHAGQIQDPKVDLLSYKDREGKFMGFSLTVYQGTNAELRRFAVTPRGQGYGEEALIATIDYFFQKEGVHRMWLDVYGENQRGIQLYRKLGLRQEGFFREFELGEDGQFRDQYIFAITKPEWMDRRKS